MQLLLTDIRSLTQEIQDISRMTQPGVDSFAGLFQENLATAPEEFDQAIDFKSFFENIPIPPVSSDEVAQATPASIWRDYLMQHKVANNIESDGAQLSRLGDVADNQVAVREVSADLKLQSKGESLPVAGSYLPQNLAVATSPLTQAVTETTLTNQISIASDRDVMNPMNDKAAAAKQPVARVGGVTPANPVVASAQILVPGATISMQATKPSPEISAGDTSNHDLADKAVSGRQNPVRENTLNRVTEPTQLLQSSALNIVNSPRDTALKSEVNIGSEHSPKAENSVLKQISATQEETQKSSLASASKASQARSTTAGLGDRLMPESKIVDEHNPVKEVARSDSRLLRDSIANAVFPTNEHSPHKEIPVVRETVQAQSRTLELHETAKIFSQPVKPITDVVTPESANLRGAETTNQALPNSTTLQTSQTVPVSINNTAFETQINSRLQPEILSMARNADATDWGNGLGERVSWMINQKQNIATIRLDPPLLGKLDVQVKIADDATVITIQTQHAQTRELIESASFRLRDFLQENGYQNVNVDVSYRQDQQQARAQTDTESEHGDETHDDADSSHRDHELARHFSSDNLLDTFA